MKVRVLIDTRVNLPANTVVEVTEMEGRRLSSLGFGEIVNEKPVKSEKKEAEPTEVKAQAKKATKKK